MPEMVQGLLLGILVAALVGGIALLLRSRRVSGPEAGGLALLQNQMQGLQHQIDTRLEGASKAITEVNQGLGRLEEASRRILEVGRDVSGLRDILQAPKVRGGLGEILLESLLAEVLPQSAFHAPHTFRKGVTVDALILLPEGSVPVDAKFPLEAYQRLVQVQGEGDSGHGVAMREFIRSVRARIDEIAEKYIIPAEGTLDFALMYVPAEAVYYEAMARGESLSGYSSERHVFLVSPSTLYLYLATVARGLKGLQIEQGARRILEGLGQLRQDFIQFKEDFDLVGTHLRRARDRYDDAQRKMDRFGERLERAHAVDDGAISEVRSVGSGAEVLPIGDPPTQEGPLEDR